MSTAELDPISHACRLLREGAAELKNCHTRAATGHDWTCEPEAKAAYDEHMAAADALERWADSIGAGGVEPLRGRQCLHQIAEPAGEYPPLPEWSKMDNLGGLVPSEIRQELRAYVDSDRAMRAAQHAVVMLGEQAELRRLSDCCPELNLSNYGPDDVGELNGWAIEVSQCIDRALAAQHAGAQEPGAAYAALTYKQVLGSKNCMQCCVSYMLGLPLESVPDFATDGGWELFSDFAESQGYAAVMLPGNREFEADYLASGTTARGTSHMVVMNDGKLVHDPHPSNAGLVDVQCIWLLAKRATPRTVQADEHAEFEPAAKAYTSNVSFERDGTGYADMTAELLWHGWKLRASHGQAPAGESLRTDALCDLSYSHGLKAGWNYCASDDLAGFERAQKIGTEALRTLKSTTAQAAPAAVAGPSEAVAYLDVGAGGYLDLGTGLTDEALSRLPKGRHALVIAGTYGIDGYTAAPTTQPAPQQEAQEPVAWYVTGCGRLLDEDEAKAEARHIGGTAMAIPVYTAPQPSPTAQGDALDAARYRYLRDGDWREHDKLESIIRLQLNKLWDAAIDDARVAQEGKSND